ERAVEQPERGEIGEPVGGGDGRVEPQREAQQSGVGGVDGGGVSGHGHTVPPRGKRVDYLVGNASWRNFAVTASAGKNASIDSSATVTSTAVPNVATVLKNDSSCPSWRSTSGSPVAATSRRRRSSRCPRHSARLAIRGAMPSGCRLTRSTLAGGSSRCEATPSRNSATL